MNLREVADQALKESEAEIANVETLDGNQQLEKLKNLMRLHKIGNNEYKSALAGLYAAGVITLSQYDAGKKMFYNHKF